jgi:protease I
MAHKSVLLVVASEGYQQIEFAETKKAVEAVGLTVKIASNSNIPAIAKDGSTTLVDIQLNEVDPRHYAGILFIGGPGTLENLDNQISYDVCKKAAVEHVPLGAICYAPRILAHAGVLENKRATGYDGDNKLADIYRDNGVTYVREPVVADGLIITATGPDAAAQFGKEAAHLIKKFHPGNAT